MAISQEHKDLIKRLHGKGGFLEFCHIFYPILYGRPFFITKPQGRRSHIYICCEELEKVAFDPTENLGIFIPPGHSKTTLLILFVAWIISMYPDCEFMYVSYSKRHSASSTLMIRAIVESELFYTLFRLKVSNVQKSKEDFRIIDPRYPDAVGGRVYATSFEGTTTGINAGFSTSGDEKRITGAMIIDDIYNVGRANSPTIVASTEHHYVNGLTPRIRGKYAPTICICQNTGEHSLIWRFIEQKDIRPWRYIMLQALDAAGNALAPEMRDEGWLRDMEKHEPYMFKTQYQQLKIPMGDALFDRQDFVMLYTKQQLLRTFIVIDAAASDKTYSDYSAFTFFGVYRLAIAGQELPQYALEVLDFQKHRELPVALLHEANTFLIRCMQHPIKPKYLFIESASMGVMLNDFMREMRGIQVIPIIHDSTSGSKADRFIGMERYIKSGLVSLQYEAPFASDFIDEIIKITPAMTHDHDDVADTLEMACDVTFKSKIAVADLEYEDSDNKFYSHLATRQQRIAELRGNYISPKGFYDGI